MYVAVRSYSGPGASELFDLIGEHQQEINTLINGVPPILIEGTSVLQF